MDEIIEYTKPFIEAQTPIMLWPSNDVASVYNYNADEMRWEGRTTFDLDRNDVPTLYETLLQMGAIIANMLDYPPEHLIQHSFGIWAFRGSHDEAIMIALQYGGDII